MSSNDISFCKTLSCCNLHDKRPHKSKGSSTVLRVTFISVFKILRVYEHCKCQEMPFAVASSNARLGWLCKSDLHAGLPNIGFFSQLHRQGGERRDQHGLVQLPRLC